MRQDQCRPGTPAVTPHRCCTYRAHPPPTLQNPCLLIFACLQLVLKPHQRSAPQEALLSHGLQMRKLRQRGSKYLAQQQKTGKRPSCPRAHALPHSTIQPGCRNSSNCFSHELMHSEGRLSVIKMSCAAHPGNRC